jgi:hypothetical protein
MTYIYSFPRSKDLANCWHFSLPVGRQKPNSSHNSAAPTRCNRASSNGQQKVQKGQKTVLLPVERVLALSLQQTTSFSSWMFSIVFIFQASHLTHVYKFHLNANLMYDQKEVVHYCNQRRKYCSLYLGEFDRGILLNYWRLANFCSNWKNCYFRLSILSDASTSLDIQKQESRTIIQISHPNRPLINIHSPRNMSFKEESWGW